MRQRGQRVDMPHLEVVPTGKHHWVVRYEGDPVPLSEHDAKEDAIAEATNHAREFPEPIIRVHDLDGEVHTMIIEPDHPGPAHPHGIGEAVQP
jgi:hypothetical protein